MSELCLLFLLFSDKPCVTSLSGGRVSDRGLSRWPFVQSVASPHLLRLNNHRFQLQGTPPSLSDTAAGIHHMI